MFSTEDIHTLLSTVVINHPSIKKKTYLLQIFQKVAEINALILSKFDSDVWNELFLICWKSCKNHINLNQVFGKSVFNHELFTYSIFDEGN